MNTELPTANASTAVMPLNFTPRAAARARQLMQGEGNLALKLRLFITGGGCAGFEYGFTFDEWLAEDDTAIEVEGATLLVDATSLPYLVGSQVDYEDGLQGSRFVVKNPRATVTCGCGSSFSLDLD